jgi:hypothetical protein
MAEKTPKVPEKIGAELAIDIIESAQADLQQALADKHEVVLIGINAKFEIMKNQLRMMAGMNVFSENKVDLPPVTEFMGDPIEKKQGKPVETKNLSARELQVKNLTDKADKLQESLDTLKNEQILESYQNDLAPIRLLAKRAGLEDFKEAQINGEYLDLIRNGFKEQEEINAAKDRDKNALNNQS